MKKVRTFKVKVACDVSSGKLDIIKQFSIPLLRAKIKCQHCKHDVIAELENIIISPTFSIVAIAEQDQAFPTSISEGSQECLADIVVYQDEPKKKGEITLLKGGKHK
jgi:hypothetical protein